LNTDFFRSTLLIARPLTILVIVFILFGSSYRSGYILDGQDYILGRDFVNMWHYGIAAFSDDPSLYYNPDYYNARLDSLIPGLNYQYQQFSYPPHFMLLSAPLGLMPYNLGFLLFTATGIGLLWKTVLRPFHKNSRYALLWTPVLALAILSGQVSVFLVVIFAAIFRNMDKNTWLTAALIALLTVKPQIGFLFPVFLLATARYKLFLQTAMLTTAFMGASVLFHGIAPWEAYFTVGIHNQADLMIYSHPLVLGLMPTLYSNIHQLGMPVLPSQIIHGVVALMALIAMVITVRKCRDKALNFIVFVATSFAVTPYLMVYDTLVLIWAVICLSHMVSFNRFDKVAVSLLLILPVFGVLMSLIGVPLHSLVIWAVLCSALSYAWQDIKSVSVIPD